jgi:adenylylsulfate kinase
MAEQKATNITWHEGQVTKKDRERLGGHKGVVVWFTGLSGSGKSTLAREVERRLHERGCRSYVLDGDNIRHGLNKNLGFSPEDREENIRRIGEVARLFADAGLVAMTAFISPYVKDRGAARALNGEGEFIEVYCRCSIEECEKRDTKGLYKKARAGQLKDFTGVDAPYEEPPRPELLIDTDKETIDGAAARIMSYLEEMNIIPPR